MSMCSCPRRQHRRRAEELKFRVERIVERLDEEPARRIFLERLLALRDRVIDDLQIVFDDGHCGRIETAAAPIDDQPQALDVAVVGLLDRGLG